MINKIILMGNLGRIPKVEVDQNGREILTFYLATKTSWKDSTGEWQQHTYWHRIVIFRESTIRWVKDVFQKGDMVYVEGRLTYHQWTDQYNQIRLTPSIIIAGNEGKVQHLLHKKHTPHSWTDGSDDQEKVLKDFEENSPHLFKACEGN